jgi:hypothetical protein
MNLSRIPTPELADELLSRADGRSELARSIAKLPRGTKILRPCPFCSKPFGAREMRTHVPRCPAR